MPEQIKLRAGEYLVPVNIWVENSRLFFQFRYNKILMADIKAMKGAKYHGYDEVNPRKLWSIEPCPHNDFQLSYLKGENPYGHYDAPLIPIYVPPRWNHSKQKKLAAFKHHPMMIAHMVQRKRCVVASEMGTAKTFGVIHALEILNEDFKTKTALDMSIWYVAPRSALRAVEREFLIWGAKVKPVFMTYESLVKRMKNWESGDKAPVAVIFDESSKVKTPAAQRTQAAQSLADGIRSDWKEDAVVILMSGSPAPKSPSDWWAQAEIACPGFIKEGDIFKFNNRLAVIVKKENFDGGGAYPQLVTWRDDPAKCDQCGALADDPIHTVAMDHAFKPSVNEVRFLYERLQGLVQIFFKKDCLDLPDKNYRTVEIKPTPSTLRAASLILKSSKTVIEGLTRLRELSDGFQYVQEKVGKQECSRCRGTLIVEEHQEVEGTCPNCPRVQDFIDSANCMSHCPQYNTAMVPCLHCNQTGEEDKISRITKQVACGKDTVLTDLLDEYEDIGRVVIYAGFTAAIDRCVAVCQKQGWHIIRIDQGKEQVFNDKGNPLGVTDYISMFQDDKETYSRVAFVAHPGSAGMGLTLTASPVIIYYSNDFNAESRIQSEDRIHRPGLDYNLGATIIDLIHLPSDIKVLDNLRKKRELQSMTLGELDEALKSGEGHERAT